MLRRAIGVGNSLERALEPSLSDHQRLPADRRVLEIYFDFGVASAPGDLGDRPAAKGAMPHALADHVRRRILRDVRRIDVGSPVRAERDGCPRATVRRAAAATAAAPAPQIRP